MLSLLLFDDLVDAVQGKMLTYKQLIKAKYVGFEKQTMRAALCTL